MQTGKKMKYIILCRSVLPVLYSPCHYAGAQHMLSTAPRLQDIRTSSSWYMRTASSLKPGGCFQGRCHLGISGPGSWHGREVAEQQLKELQEMLSAERQKREAHA